MVAFAQATRQAEFYPGPKERLVEATVRDTIGCLSQAFKEALRYYPRRDPDGSLSFLLEQTFNGYANEDPGVKQQKELPIIILLKALDLAETYLSIAIVELVCATFFSKIRPCEYTKTLTTAESKRTNITTLGNIRFYRNNRIL